MKTRVWEIKTIYRLDGCVCEDIHKVVARDDIEARDKAWILITDSQKFADRICCESRIMHEVDN